MDDLEEGRDHFQRGWAYFSPLALTDQNIGWCKQYGLEVPRNDAGYYDY